MAEGISLQHLFYAFMLMLNGGGRAIEDIREIKVDEGLRELLCIEQCPAPLNPNILHVQKWGAI